MHRKKIICVFCDHRRGHPDMVPIRSRADG
jgi:hypothetical protein